MYQTTHPWLKFELDLRRLRYDLWIMLGECQSKCEHIAGKILLCSGVPAPAAQLLSNHHNQTRRSYRQLQRSSKPGGDCIPFMRYAVQGFRDGLREQIDEIRAQHVEVTRINYVHDTFRGPHGHADGRRKRLILELSAVSKEWVGVEELTHLSPELAVEHSARTGKTALRDLERLEEVGLIERKDRKVRVNQTAILAFLPIQANQVEVVEESN